MKSPNSERDHPRVCGEHLVLAVLSQDGLGSSPRVRGTFCDVSLALCSAGIIPACAGNIRAALLVRDLEWDHPRVCGEHDANGAMVTGWQGSSPRVRGTWIGKHLVLKSFGIIPACAGNMGWNLRPQTKSRDHPRVCGEH